LTNDLFINSSKKDGKLKEEDIEIRLDSCNKLINARLEQDKVLNFLNNIGKFTNFNFKCHESI